MPGRHAPASRRSEREPRPARAGVRVRSVRKAFAASAVTVLAFSIAAAMTIPAVASNETATVRAVQLSDQKLTVSQKAALQAVLRDKFTIGHIYRDGGPGIGSVDGWAKPTTARITSGWGPRGVICTAGAGCDSGFHHGDDFAAACGTPFYAASGGTISAITYGGLAGDEIVISYGADGISTAYSHMFDDGIFVQVGQTVVAGQNIGAMGSSGDSTGCHLYFEYRVNNVTVDPVPAMATHGITLG